MKKVILAAALLSGGSLALAEDSVEVWSRNMPETCEFVYRVESDIRVLFANPDAAPLPQMSYRFRDEYSGQWSRSGRVPFKLRQDGLWQADLALESFSAHEHRLQRVLQFSVNAGGHKEGDWSVEFGRQFGEPCYSAGRLSTPYLRRSVQRLL